jgi:heavy metal sensor kinase
MGPVFKSVRLRLTFWHVMVFALLLSGFSVLLYAFFSRDLYDRFDASISSAANVAGTFFQNEVRENKGNVLAGALETLSELPLSATAIAIFEADHQPLAASNPEIVQFVSRCRLLDQVRRTGRPAFATLRGADRRQTRLVALPPVAVEGRACYIAAAQPLDSLAEQLRLLRRILFAALPSTVLISGLAGFLLARKSLAPVVAMSNQAASISAKSLHQRLDVGNAKDELGCLATVFNELLSRLERSFESMRTFMADASHELRTPLAIIRGEADVALSQPHRPEGEYRESLSVILDEGRRLSRLVDDMLVLARADAGQPVIHREQFYLNDVLEECCRAARPLSQQKHLSLTLDVPSDVPFRGDPGLVRQMTLNLLDNAIRYTPSGGSVLVKLTREEDSARIIVSDTGVGIPPESVDRVFERFYRVDKARSRAEGGSGLGLSIVKWVVEAHRGSVKLASDPGHGTTFTVSLPL